MWKNRWANFEKRRRTTHKHRQIEHKKQSPKPEQEGLKGDNTWDNTRGKRELEDDEGA